MATRPALGPLDEPRALEPRLVDIVEGLSVDAEAPGGLDHVVQLDGTCARELTYVPRPLEDPERLPRRPP